MDTKSSLKRNSRGAALIELAMTFPVVLLIVLGTIHCSIVLREANMIVEASRHGARSAAAQSGLDPTNTGSAPLSYNATCSNITSPVSANKTVNAAAIASCNYLNLSGLVGSEWNINVQIGTLTEDVTTLYTITVTISAFSNRGPVDSIKSWLHMQPTSTAVFPLEVL